MAKKQAAIEETKELVRRSNMLPASPLMEEDAGAGTGNAGAESYSIPYLVVLQKGSPQCDPSDGKYIDGAKQGQLFNTVTQECVDGDKGVLVVPVEFLRAYTEWVDRNAGGGFRGMHQVDADIVKLAQPGPSGRLLTESGNYLNDTRYHFCLIVTDERIDQAVLSLSSTQIKKSKQWMTQMRSLKLKGKNGLFTPPTFSHVYRITTVPESNEKGKWYGIKVVLERPLILTDELDLQIYQIAKAFREQVATGTAKVADPGAIAETESSEAIPF